MVNLNISQTLDIKYNIYILYYDFIFLIYNESHLKVTSNN
jgi:hypothetical protein